MSWSPAPPPALLLGLLLLAVSCRQAERSLESGMLVVSVASGMGGDLAGLRPGDVLVRHREGSDRLDGPWEVRRLEIEVAPRAEVTLEAERRVEDGEIERLRVSPRGEWGLEVRPLFGRELEAVVEAARARRREEDLEGALDLLRSASEGGALTMEARVWLSLERSELLRRLGRRHESAAAALEAVAATDGGAQGLRLWSLDEGADRLVSLDRHDDARALLEEALELAAAEGEESLLVAHLLDRLGTVKARAGALEEARRDFERALALRRRRAPGSLVVAASLNNLGNHHSDPAEQERLHREALELRRRLAPGSRDEAMSRLNLGNVLWSRGDLLAAEEELRIASTLLAGMGTTIMRAMSLGNLSLVVRDRGDLQNAESYARQALQAFVADAPQSSFVAEAYGILGGILRRKGDVEAATTAFERARDIWRETAPGRDGEARALSLLASVAQERDQTAEAERLWREALRIAQRPQTRGAVLISLGQLFTSEERYSEAESTLDEALRLWREVAPGSTWEAGAKINRAGLARRQSDLDAARAGYEEALATIETVAPGSWLEALCLFRLAQTVRAQGQPEEALEILRRALRALEEQVGRLGGSLDQAIEYRTRHLEYYEETIDLLLELGEPEQALRALDRSQGRAFLALLATRDLHWQRDLPPALGRERRLLLRAIGRLEQRLGAGGTPEELAPLRAELVRLEEERLELEAEIARAAPRLQAFSRPHPLDLGRLRSTLGERTAALVYHLADHASALFLVDSEGVESRSLAVGRAEIERQTTALRALIGAAASGIDRLSAVEERAEELYRLLLEPAEERLQTSDRLVVVPDGPLHSLPFGALRRPAAGAESGSWLVESKELVFAPSLSAYLFAAAQKPPQGAREARLVAFGDPRVDAGIAEARAADDLLLRRLPYSREEVETIARTVGDGARLYLGSSASEARARSLSGFVPWLHFAVHGMLDERLPLESGLVLAATNGGRNGEDGILQAWEILESLRFDSELVVLAACESALGEPVAGEGLLSLTRAFQYAGARSVVASLWQVSDRSTALLMKSFYEGLVADPDPGAALRSAQLALLAGEPIPPADRRPWLVRLLRPRPDTVAPKIGIDHPFHWAAFQRYGVFAPRPDSSPAGGP